MELPKKLKLIRSSKNWTQEEIAEKLKISTHAYAKIERGETDIHLSRLKQLAKVMEIGLSQLLDSDEKNVFNLCNNWQVNSSSNEKYRYELEKANLIIEEREKEIEYLKQQVVDLREMNNILKSKG